MKCEYRQLGDVAIQFIDGDRGKNYPSNNEFSNVGYCLFLNAKNVTPDGFSFGEVSFITQKKDAMLRKGKLEKNDVVLTTRGTVGNVAFYGERVLYSNVRINSGMLIIRPDPSVFCPEYVYWLFRSDVIQDQIKRFRSGTAQPQLPISSIKKFEIPLVDIKTQEKIAAILSALDEKIATNRAINDNLEQQVSALYQSWFEDFEPSNGICPEHWSYQELSTIANIVSGKRPPIKSEVCNQETSIPIVGAASIMGFTSQSNHTDKILVTGRVGTHGVVQRFNVPCWTSDNTLVITSPFYEFTNQILCRIDYSSMNRGSTQPLITQGDMKKVIVLIPDEKTLAKFEEFAGSLMAKWEANNHENIQLALLRDSLLPKLMSGEIDVSAIQL